MTIGTWTRNTELQSKCSSSQPLSVGPTAQAQHYGALLAAGDRRGAFAEMVRGAGGAPPALERMPLWYVKLRLRLFIRANRWQIDPLLEAGLAEHEQVAALDQSTADRYRDVTARVVLLGGGKSRPPPHDRPLRTAHRHDRELHQ
jgi:hypothetical protein